MRSLRDNQLTTKEFLFAIAAKYQPIQAGGEDLNDEFLNEFLNVTNEIIRPLDTRILIFAIIRIWKR
jgi:hypothetical protein